MFCKKCGNPLPEGADFCQRCGSRVSRGSGEQNPAPPYNAPAVGKAPFPLKYVIIPVAILALAAIIIAAVITPPLDGGEVNATQNGADTSIAASNGGASIAVGSANETAVNMTAGGESVNVDLAYFCPIEGGYAVGVYGTGGGSVQALSVEAGLPGTAIAPNTTYTNANVVVGIVSGGQASNFTAQNISDLKVTVGDYSENQSLVVRITGSAELNGSPVNFAARGSVSYKSESDAQSALGAWQSSVSSLISSGGNNGGSAANACPGCGGSGYCASCGGSGICSICHGRGGLSVPTYGQGGDDRVVCDGCKGNGSCSQCTGGICPICGGSGQV